MTVDALSVSVTVVVVVVHASVIVEPAKVTVVEIVSV